MIVYRIVRSNPPTDFDFLSHQARGIKLRQSTPELDRISTGLSVTLAFEDAEALVRQRPHLGKFIAAFELPESGEYTLEQTGKSKGHYTLWCEPELLASCLVAVTALEE